MTTCTMSYLCNKEKKIPVGKRFFAHVQTGPGAQPASCTMGTGPGAHPASCTVGTGYFPGVKRPGRDADHPPLLAPRLRKGSAILLPTL
jgi:hypothetical protein